MSRLKLNKTPSSTDRSAQLARRLLDAIPVARVELSYRSAWELLVATILSAQCTDERVNQVTPALFQRYKTPEALAGATSGELQVLIKPTGFYRSKAKNLIGCAHAVVTRFNGKVPETMEELTSIPGVGRKTANVLLGAAFGKPGIVVDTHVKRVANRLSLTGSRNPEHIERDLQAIFPESKWTAVSQRLLLHGRYVCLARRPQCVRCPIEDICRWEGKVST